MNKLKVKSIDTFQTKEWFLRKHYAHRMPPISYSFGLYNNNELVGVCSFGDCGGSTNSHTLIDGYKVNELNRLIVNEGLEKNSLSYFVSHCLKLLPKPMAIISYSDISMGHHGYIYQATNWTYTGQTKGDYEFIKSGRQYHRKSIYDLLGTGNIENAIKNGYEVIRGTAKHRYFYFLGNKRQKKEMIELLKYSKCTYPKGENKRYNASYKPSTQKTLF